MMFARQHNLALLFFTFASLLQLLVAVSPVSRAQVLPDEVDARIRAVLLQLQEIAEDIRNVECASPAPAPTPAAPAPSPTVAATTSAPDPTTTAPEATAADDGTSASSCESPSVWNAMAGDYTCGARIDWKRSADGGGLSDADAKNFVVSSKRSRGKS